MKQETATLESSLAPQAICQKSWARRQILKAFGGLERGRLHLHLPEGETLVFGQGTTQTLPALPCGVNPEAHIHIHREAFFERCLWYGDIGFAEAFMEGDWTSENPTAVVAWFIHNLDEASALSGSKTRRVAALNLLGLANRVRHLLRPNSRSLAKKNIQAHYDLSNAFFSLWLDPSMMYSSARWSKKDLSLEEAQREKNEALCRALRLKPDDRVLEIGCGWGGWALHAVRHYGCRVLGLTLSERQAELARSRVAEAGLVDKIEIRVQDFRSVTGSYDKIVSIEMMEALGHHYLPTFAETLGRLLKPAGLLALQYITCPDARYEAFRRGVDFIQKHVFPGSLLLSSNRVNDLLSRKAGLLLHSHEDFGPDYARTLHLWRKSFESSRAAVLALGFDESFLRKWRYYLSYCEAAFALRNISVVQTLHTRPNNLALN